MEEITSELKSYIMTVLKECTLLKIAPTKELIDAIKLYQSLRLSTKSKPERVNRTVPTV